MLKTISGRPSRTRRTWLGVLVAACVLVLAFRLVRRTPESPTLTAPNDTSLEGAPSNPKETMASRPVTPLVPGAVDARPARAIAAPPPMPRGAMKIPFDALAEKREDGGMK